LRGHFVKGWPLSTEPTTPSKSKNVLKSPAESIVRIAEVLQSGFAVLLAVTAWLPALRSLPARRRFRITALAAFVVFADALACATPWFLPSDASATLRDWLPVVLMLVPYWQTGQFFRGPNPKVQRWLLRIDLRWIGRTAARSGTARTRLGLALEIAYVFCYPFVPLGLAALYIGGRRTHADFFWLVVLIATYLCYAITPFFPAMPPRDGTKSAPGVLTPATGAIDLSAGPQNHGRRFNRWIQEWGSIHAISFPSAHVASTLAVSLVLLRWMPVTGPCFLAGAVLIAVAAVAGRYHYLLDVLLGAAVALSVFAVCFLLYTPGS
jgi:membrane-associated phospholipid phosphatase